MPVKYRFPSEIKIYCISPRVPRENHWPVASHGKIYHIMLYHVHFAWAGFVLATLVMRSTECTDNCKSNYHTITVMTAPCLCNWSFKTYHIFVEIRRYFFKKKTRGILHIDITMKLFQNLVLLVIESILDLASYLKGRLVYVKKTPQKSLIFGPAS